MDAKSILYLLKFVPEISDKYFNYLTTKSKNDYDKLNVALQAYGFTIQQLFDNIDSESFIKSYQSTHALDASISVIQNSNEFTDKEKYEKLQEIHEKEVAQQNRAQKHELSKKIITTGSIASILIVGSIAVGSVVHKKGFPIPSSSHQKLIVSKIPFVKALTKK